MQREATKSKWIVIVMRHTGKHLSVVLAGPLVFPSIKGRMAGIIVIIVMTLFTQIGGIAIWPVFGLSSMMPPEKRFVKASILAILTCAVTVFVVVPPIAKVYGRVVLPCGSDTLLQPYSKIFCATARNYVVEELYRELMTIATVVEREYPGTRIFYLDAGFPFGGGFPLLPHLSHADGKKVDLALYFQSGGSPIGYLAYVPIPKGRSPECPSRWMDLRWDLEFLQPLFGPPVLDVRQTATLVRVVVDRPAIGKVFIEPHIRDTLGVTSEKIRFQGCAAARHDDHLHVQLR